MPVAAVSGWTGLARCQLTAVRQPPRRPDPMALVRSESGQIPCSSASPVTGHTLNYSPIAVGVVLAFTGGWWLISAGH